MGMVPKVPDMGLLLTDIHTFAPHLDPVLTGIFPSASDLWHDGKLLLLPGVQTEANKAQHLQWHHCGQHDDGYHSVVGSGRVQGLVHRCLFATTCHALVIIDFWVRLGL